MFRNELKKFHYENKVIIIVALIITTPHRGIQLIVFQYFENLSYRRTLRGFFNLDITVYISMVDILCILFFHLLKTINIFYGPFAAELCFIFTIISYSTYMV